MPNIIIDDREKPIGAIDSELQVLGVSTKRERLDVGDYLLYDNQDQLVLVTRKAADLFTSTFDGHFSDELNRCIEAITSYGGGRLFWLLEGIWATGYPNGSGGMKYFKRSGIPWFRYAGTDSGTAESAFANMQVSLQSAGVEYVTSSSLHETALLLAAIYQRAQDGWPSKLTQGLARPTLKWSDDTRAQRLMGLWPHLREQVAVELLAEYESIGNILAMVREGDHKRLLQVPGIGKKGLQNLLEVIQ
jgi:ERCC4-type nuclease